MKKQNLLWISAFLIMCIFALFVIFSDNAGALKIKNAIVFSLEEDFKIKESLGQLFLVEQQEDSVSASTNVNVSAFISPSATGKINSKNVLGRPQIEIECEKYSSILATGDGTIETVKENKITLRHSDGKLSVYNNVSSLVKAGDTVKKGDSIGYALGNVEYKLYENCIALDPMEYIS